ncbi:MAG: type II toxin-antitoxin system RelE/ParE family toxin [Dissulfurispiraceae bacterium]|jgi:putative addiction module killer protein
MQAFPYELEYYVSETGNRPFKEWLEVLKDVPARAKIRVRLDRVRLGNLGNNRPVGEGVRELIINYGPGYRVYFAQDGIDIILFFSEVLSQVSRRILKPLRNI